MWSRGLVLTPHSFIRAAPRSVLLLSMFSGFPLLLAGPPKGYVPQTSELSCGAAALATLFTFPFNAPVSEAQIAQLYSAAEIEYLAHPTTIAYDRVDRFATAC